MRQQTIYRLLALLTVSLFWVGSVTAQETGELIPFVTFEGAISEDTPQQAWTFSAITGEVVSLVVAGDGDFDPLLQITNSDGGEVIRNDDAAYPRETDAIIEAMTVPRTGTYTVTVTGFGSTTGTYAITLLHGYSQLTLQNAADNAGWTSVSGDLSVTSGEMLTVTLEGVNQRGVATNEQLATVGDFYAELRVGEIIARNTWTVGLSLRQRASRSVVVAVNARGQWRADLVNGENSVTLRDWTLHPAIVPEQTTFTLGVLGIGDGFNVFYDGQFMGQFISTEPARTGRVGVMVATADAINSAVEAQFDALTITTPRQIAGDDLFPAALIPGTQTQLIQELERRRIIPPGGRLALNVGESFTESAQPGLALVELGRGATYTNYVIATTTSISLRTNTGAGPSGCGLVFRRTGEDEYTVAYVDSDGGYGVSTRETNAFIPGLYAQNPAYATLLNHALLVVVRDDVLHYYVNHTYAGQLDITPVTGVIGNALVNFEANNTACDFTDTWLWTWDEE